MPGKKSLSRAHLVKSYGLVIGFGLSVFFTLIPPAVAQETASVPDFRHVKVENPASLSHEDAERVYTEISEDLVRAFEASGVAEIQGYKNWRRYNHAPYLSSTHGNRYINNFANAASVGYESLRKGSRMPQGSVLIKDSFAVTDTGEVLPGRLFVMEKLAPGTSAATGDWRYIMIDANGTILADTAGGAAVQAEFCHTCHKVRASKDFLFYVPPDFRLPVQ